MSSACFNVPKFSTKRRDRGKSSRDTIYIWNVLYTYQLKFGSIIGLVMIRGEGTMMVIGARAPIYK